jgi:hypothetical protein
LTFDPVNTLLLEDNNVAFRIQPGIALRGIGGDIARKEFAALRQNILGSKKKLYFGVEIPVFITFRSITGKIQVFILTGGKAGGVTGGQVGGGFNISAPIFGGYTLYRR